ncbi:hypothetical protein [Microbacterium aurugineum]|uniref:hypothetical protein n=1 Tax=Microbacterium aurugineum TaxID=2851642 RepID=UPI0020BDF16D|nr:hypothetical protein [Microbacterium aurugineum]MCK8476024.1 hypothetical protein [Microbacterium aurugineum]
MMADTRKKDPKPAPGRLERLHDWVTSPGGRVLRYLLVLLIVGSAVYLSLTGWFQVCEVVDSEKEGITRTCSGPNLTSAGVLAAVIFVLLLLWPDLSEFSAFGVTLKKLVQKVEEKVTETRDKTTHIDDTTTATRSRLEDLQTTVTTQGGDISERLSLIQADLTSLSAREAERDAAPPYSDAVPFPSTATPLAPAPRWDAFDRDNFVHACEELFDAETLESVLASLDESVDRQTWARAAEAGIDTHTTAYSGLTLDLFRSFRTHWDRIRHDRPHAPQVDAILRSIEWMLLAMVSGRRVDDTSLRFAAAALVLFHRYEL